jgi:hypothetical protein
MQFRHCLKRDMAASLNRSALQPRSLTYVRIQRVRQLSSNVGFTMKRRWNRPMEPKIATHDAPKIQASLRVAWQCRGNENTKETLNKFAIV